MSSILTNTSSMVALQTLKGINSALEKTQAEISTGKSVASAKDNSAMWAISKVMESDVAGFQAISDSLALGESTVALARNASETVTDLLTDIKGKIIAAQEENVDREKIQTDIDQLTNQITSVVDAAQFNGLNLVKGTDDVQVLSSLDRASGGGVSSSSITVARQDLSSDSGVAGNTAATAGGYASITTFAGNATTGKTATTTAAGADPVQATTNASTGQFVDISLTAANNELYEITVGGQTVSYTSDASATDAEVQTGLLAQLNALGLDGVTFAAESTDQIRISNTNAFDALTINTSSDTDANLDIINYNDATDFTGGALTADTIVLEQRATSFDFSQSAAVTEGDTFSIALAGAGNYSYIAGKNETMEDVARGLKIAIDAAADANVTAQVQDNNGQVRLAVDDATGGRVLSLDVTTGGTASGGLFGLENIDVTTSEGATAALENIETLIQNSIDASAEFGSTESRIEIQSNFIGNLKDSLKAGIGTLVDANMEEASARLQALQVQQQLGVQSLSIANQAPQSILSLFR